MSGMEAVNQTIAELLACNRDHNNPLFLSDTGRKILAVREHIVTLSAQLEAAEAEVAKHCRDRELYVLVTPQEVEQWLAAEADAARYRWLREEAARFKAHDPRGELVVSVTRLQRRTDNTGFTGLAVTPVGPEFDAAIDAARTKEQQA